MFDKLQAFMEKYFIPVSNKIAANRILKGISGGFAMLMPVIMAGAISSLLSGFSIEAYQTFITNVGLKPLFTMVTDYTTNMMALYAVFAIGYGMASQLECAKTAVAAGLMSLMSFLLVIPLGTTVGETAVGGVITTMYFGAPGLFTAMILGCLIPSIYNFFVKHNVVIKMPDGVPPQIANGFAGIIPGVAIAAFAILIRQLCLLTPFGDLNNLIYSILRAPLASLQSSPFTFVLFLLLCNLLWFFGIHGGMVVMPFLSMLYTNANLENVAAYAAGEALPNMITGCWWQVQAQLGGSGAAIGLAFCMLLLAKSQRYKTLGKLAIAPAVCSISEPMVFGFPLVLNPVMFIPMLLSPLVCFGLSSILTLVGILPFLNGVGVPTGTPIVLAGLLTGGWRVAVWQVVLVALQFAIYLPFFKMMDKQALAEEAQETANV